MPSESHRTRMNSGLAPESVYLIVIAYSTNCMLRVVVVVYRCVNRAVCFSISVNARGKDGMTTEEMRKLIERSVEIE